jgi:hypothetical protein
MSRFLIAAALIASFTVSVRAAAPASSHATAIAIGKSSVVDCPSRCVIANPGVRL